MTQTSKWWIVFILKGLGFVVEIVIYWSPPHACTAVCVRIRCTRVYYIPSPFRGAVAAFSINCLPTCAPSIYYSSFLYFIVIYSSARWVHSAQAGTCAPKSSPAILTILNRDRACNGGWVKLPQNERVDNPAPIQVMYTNKVEVYTSFIVSKTLLRLL